MDLKGSGLIMYFWNRHPGVVAALAAALLFGAGTPFAKILLGPVSPWLLAGLLYLGSGLGLWAWRGLRRHQPVRPGRADMGWLAGAVLSGGIIAPVCLLWGLMHMPASGASLLLNLEGVFTALIAWFVFRENFDRRIAAGMALIVGGALVLSWPQEVDFGALAPSAAVAAACLFWAIDNNLTRKVALLDASFIAMTKGLTAGAVNTAIALLLGAALPPLPVVLAAGGLGLVSYGFSLVLFVLALRHLGTARTGAYFSTAPFAGAVIAVAAMGEPFTFELAIAGALMAVGVWLHVTERHQHLHEHQPMAHVHEHTHDEHDDHHQHAHSESVSPGVRHSHWHQHDPLMHGHVHYPDAHHQHHTHH